MSVGTFGWLTLRPSGSGKAEHDGNAHRVGSRLSNEDESHTVSARIRTDGTTKGWTHIRVFKENVGWCRIVLDDKFNMVAIGVGKREKESFERARAVMAAKGYPASERD